MSLGNNLEPIACQYIITELRRNNESVKRTSFNTSATKRKCMNVTIVRIFHITWNVKLVIYNHLRIFILLYFIIFLKIIIAKHIKTINNRLPHYPFLYLETWSKPSKIGAFGRFPKKIRISHVNTSLIVLKIFLKI